jgi:hypothetical protein
VEKGDRKEEFKIKIETGIKEVLEIRDELKRYDY